MDSLLLRGDRFVEIVNVTQTFKLGLGGDSEITEISRLVRVTIRGETGSLLLSGDRLVEARRSNRFHNEFPRLLRGPGLSGAG